MAEEVDVSLAPALECPVCLQSAVQPIKLPCSHIFCFLCVKGASAQNQACPMCRSPISRGYLESPEVIGGGGGDAEEDEDSAQNAPEYAWFYEGRDGWWRYDERTSSEMESIYASLSNQEGEEEEEDRMTTELLIAGFIYIIDFENKVQYRKNYPGRRRKIKRDVFNAPSKGVAGLRKDNSSSSQKDDILHHRFNNLNIVDPSTQTTDLYPSSEEGRGGSERGLDAGNESVS